jgi:hypothetical protein
MKYSDEILMAYADGELDEATRAEIDAAAAADPAVAAAIARHRQLRERLRAGFDRVLDEPVPRRLVEALDASADAERAAGPAPLPMRHAAPPAGVRRWSWPEWGALAATLVVGAFLGFGLRPAPAPLMEREGGRLVAGGELARTLSGVLAQDAAPGAEIRPGLSFRGTGGEYCRTFAMGELAGLVCQDRGRWQIEMLATAPAVAMDGYRMAGVALPPAVLEAVEARLEGEPLDAAGEVEARERGWRD